MKKSWIILLLIMGGVLIYINKRDKNSNEQQIFEKPSQNTGSFTKTPEKNKDKPVLQEDRLIPDKKKEEDKKKEKQSSDKPQNLKKAAKNHPEVKEVLNSGKIVVTEGLDKKIDIHQNFIYPNEKGEYLSRIYSLDIENPGFISLSAYTLDMRNDLRLYYRYNNGENWSSWLEIPKDKEMVNHRRNVFGLVNIQDSVKEIQFKSNVPPRKEVVFHFFIPQQ